MDRTTLKAQARFAIQDICHAYAEHLDRGNLESMAALFAQAKIVLPDGVEVTGSDEVFEHYRDIIQFYSAKGKPKKYKRGKTTPRTSHVTSNYRYVFDNAVKTAKVSSCFTALQELEPGQIAIVAAGRYQDTFLRDLSGWRIDIREIQFDLRGDLSRHLIEPD